MTNADDPRAALDALEHAYMHNAAPEGMLRELTERGVLLVTEDDCIEAAYKVLEPLGVMGTDEIGSSLFAVLSAEVTA